MNSEELTQDELQLFDLRLFQPKHGYRYSLDALLLARFCPVLKPGGSIVDLGAGCSVIGLVLARINPEVSVVAVEKNPAMAEIVECNILHNDLAARVSVQAEDILHLRKTYPDSTFDLVVSNPPYRAVGSGRVSPRTGRDTARHESTARLADFLSAAKYLVKPSGRICFVYHPDRLAEFVHRATEQNLSLLRLRMVHGVPHGNARIFLAELAKDSRASTVVMPPLIIRGEDGEYTREAKTIFGEDA